MKIQTTIKQVGKRRPLIDTQKIEINDLPLNATLKDLIIAVVHQQIDTYIQKRTEKNMLPFLTEKNINTSVDSGKVSFGEIYNDNLDIDKEKSVETAIIAFGDGMYCVFVDSEQIEHLDERITLTENSVLTFVRLTFLAGSLF